MTLYIQIVKKFFRKLSFFFPTRLPNGMTEFETWAKDIIDTYNLPDNPSVRFAFASQILHSGATEAYRPKRYFVLLTLKGMSNQIAHGVMQDLKAKQQAAEEAAKASVTDESEG